MPGSEHPVVPTVSAPAGGAAWPRIGLTLGDPAGIGPEVALQALARTGAAERARIMVFVAAELLDWLRRSLRALHLDEAQATGPGLELRAVPGRKSEPVQQPEPGRSTLHSREQAFRALEAMATAAVGREIGAMVTGPSPKGIFDHLQPRPPGQTEYLAGRLQAPRFAMMLAGPRLRVVPVTTHVPLKAVADLLTTQGIVDCGLAAADALVRFFGVPVPRLAVCGLNPHAGEEGRLGDEEARIIAPAVARLRELGIDTAGPEVADTVFHRALQGRFDAVLCMYHDQALGPLKTVHFHDACNLTCGLPVPRISPDHGTAYDIAGLGLADPASMIQALLRAERMAAAAETASEVTHVP